LHSIIMSISQRSMQTAGLASRNPLTVLSEEIRKESRIVAYHRGIPLPKGGMTLAVLALGNLLAGMFPSQAIALHIIFGILPLPLFMTIITKFFLHPGVVLAEDMSNPVVAPVSATILMSLMQYASYIAPAGGILKTLAVALWYFAVSCNIVLMAHIASRFIVKHFDLANVFPTWFVGFVGIVVASATSQPVEQQAFGLIIFWCGFVFYAVTFVVVTLRMAKIPVAQAARPTIAIYAAPMSLSIAGYTTAETHPNPVFVLIMVICAQLLFAFVLTQMPALLHLPFAPSYAAMTFPFVITATALLKSLSLFRGVGWLVPTWLFTVQKVETVVAAIVVFYVFALFIKFGIEQWRKTDKLSQ
ncbi:TDT family transporter, partial [Bifidobacterium aquikefiri]|uniref:TDT family transporter n=2 Tax=Bifidobacterium aquikefiri TaxID=1653207 RepID=UPI0039EB71B0